MLFSTHRTCRRRVDSKVICPSLRNGWGFSKFSKEKKRKQSRTIKIMHHPISKAQVRTFAYARATEEKKKSCSAAVTSVTSITTMAERKIKEDL
mmetsp:Transcript_15075/g.29623  ORF Transcript_15075/g.29623 Transcript_15075/m.29623 type:complete len:94 (+) Transcript_15075:865-1146(+)